MMAQDNSELILTKIRDKEGRKTMARCEMCGKSIGFFDKKANIAGGKVICENCVGIAGYSLNPAVGGNDISELLYLSADQIKANIVQDKAIAERMKRTNSRIGNFAMFDEEEKIAILASKYSVMMHPHNYSVLRYDQITECELIENGNTLDSGGLSGAVVGGLLFGATGAIIGSSAKKTTQTCENLMIKVTIANANIPAIYIEFINRTVGRNTPFYQESTLQAQDVMSKLKLIIEENRSRKADQRLQAALTAQAEGLKLERRAEPHMLQTKDPVEEIRKYKGLMDEGIISPAEFEEKKRMLLAM